MTVVDASVYVNALVGVGLPGRSARAELRSRPVLEVPAIFGVEVVSALRTLVRHGSLSLERATAARERARRVRMLQYPFEPFSRRVWELRDSLTAYDAWYVALAERLSTDLVTADARLSRAVGPRCAVRLI